MEKSFLNLCSYQLKMSLVILWKLFNYSVVMWCEDDVLKDSFDRCSLLINFLGKHYKNSTMSSLNCLLDAMESRRLCLCDTIILAKTLWDIIRSKWIWWLLKYANIFLFSHKSRVQQGWHCGERTSKWRPFYVEFCLIWLLQDFRYSECRMSKRGLMDVSMEVNKISKRNGV